MSTEKMIDAEVALGAPKNFNDPVERSPKRPWVKNLCKTALVIGPYLLITVAFLDLKNTKSELALLRNYMNGVCSSRYSLAEKRALCSETEPTPSPDLTSSTERGKRDIEPSVSSGFPLLAHFKGAVPQSVITEGGLISPWYKDRSAAGDFALGGAQVREGRGAGVVAVPQSGLYLIYSQVFYLSADEATSYSIVICSDEGRETTLSTCSSAGSKGESSCYTSAARYLRKGERLLLRQHERNRHILLGPGQTFLGVLLLSPSTST